MPFGDQGLNTLRRFWGNLRTSFWFVPFLIVTFSIALAAALIAADSAVGDRSLARWPRLLGADAIGARAILSTIAGSMMTVVGVTFSMTLVTLALASSQYSSRILSNFIRDRITQVGLGIFAGIFTYCLIVLRTIRVGEEISIVASLAVSFSIVLAIGGIGVLIYFIHHIASSIQASSIIAVVADETMVAVDRILPSALGQAADDDDAGQTPRAVAQRVWQSVPGIGNGYIQSVDGGALMLLACRHKTIVRMEHGIGAFLVQGTPLVSVALDSPPDDELVAIVDMAMRALSPSVNDTTTAVICVDYLTAILSRLAVRDIPSPHRLDDGELRVIAVGQTFASLVSESVDQIRSSAAGNVAIMLRLLAAIHTIASLTPDPLRRQVLREQVAWIAELAARTVAAPHDRARLEHRLAQVREGFESVPVVTGLS